MLAKLSASVRYSLGTKGPSGFGSSTTAEEVATTYDDHVRGKTIIVTGATSGIGKETVRVLAKHGADVYACARTQAKGEALVAELKKELPAEAQLHVLVMDQESLESVRQAAAAFKKEGKPLHVLINNAGVMLTADDLRTAEGYELHFGVNHLAHFLFTELLIDQLVAGAPSRVINVSSWAHTMFRPRNGIVFDMDTLIGLNTAIRYGNSKLANALYAKEFSKRQASQGVTAYSVHPGSILTNLHRRTLGETTAESIILIGASRIAMCKTIPQGAATQVYCALSPDVVPGEYYSDCNVDHVFRDQLLGDEAMATHLYEYSAQLVQLSPKQ